MAPRPARNFQQSQPITTGLRIICESYPAGTCLRELLQNADDARASEIEYVLDTNYYTKQPLLDESLQEYHGPALLVKNNSIFTDQDFSSIASVGDSRKRNDASTTGKFGLGFNSVYHWTDGPWILSRRWLLLLDPHKRWSKATDMPGGPTWDYIENHDSVELQNHLETFRTFDLNMSKETNHTIIRIPLRTAAQAKTSEIATNEIRLDDIKNALELFGQEMKEGGLLFLKYIRKITLRVDDDLVAMIQVLDNNSNGLNIRDELPSDFKRLYVQAQPKTEVDVHKIFELDIEYSTGSVSTVSRYLIQHTMLRSSGDNDMDIWARQKKLFPWTAVAAPLFGKLPKDPFRGQLFSTLRLPIFTNHPVHIHGLWSIAPDRGRLLSDNDETKWNRFMFQRCAASSWVSLLLHRSQISWQEELFGLWPHTISTPSDIWSHLIDWVLDKIIIGMIPVWNTANGCVNTGQGFFSASSGEARKYASALADIRLPAVFLNRNLLEKTSERANAFSQHLSMVTPSAVQKFLRVQPNLVSSSTTPLLLEYCLVQALNKNTKEKTRESIYHDLQGIAIWPVLDGTLSSLEDLLLPRDLEEMELFLGARKSQTLDLNRLTVSVLELLLRDIKSVPSLRFRTITDLQQDWPLLYPVTSACPNSDTLFQRPPGLDLKVGAIWKWVCARASGGEIYDFSMLETLWLLPVKDSLIRRFAPGSDSFPMLIVEKTESQYQLMADISSGSRVVGILDTSLLPPEAIQFLRKQVKKTPQIGGACLDHLESLVAWLAVGRNSVIQVSPQQKTLLLETLSHLAKNKYFSTKVPSALTCNLKSLPLYSKSSSVAPFKDRHITKCDLSGPDRVIELPDSLPPMPDVHGISFFNLSNASERSLVDKFGLLDKMSLKAVLETYLLPWATNVTGSAVEPKENLIDFIFNDLKSKYPSDPLWSTMIATHPIIPLALNHDQSTKRYGYLKNLILPQSLLSKLYFEREDIFPDKLFFEKHKIALSASKIRSVPTLADMVNRIQYFSKCSADEIVDKVELLLSLPVPDYSKLELATINTIRILEWLPGKPTGRDSIALLSPNDCRGADMSALTDLVLGATTFLVEDSWNKILGWDKPVPKEILLRQLEGCVAQRHHRKVNQILDYHGLDDYSDLKNVSCILSSRKNYHKPSNTFLPGGLLNNYPMAPVLDEVDLDFKNEHQRLMKAMNICQEPSLEKITEVQRSFQTSGQKLGEPDLKIIISSLEIAVRLYDESELTDMLVPDTQNVLRRLSDIVYGDQNVYGPVAEFNFTHPEISTKVIKGLGVEESLGRATRLDIEFEDEDEDEYTPREKLTTVISDTLGRYSIESTFNEYLANAEDCGATKICWILDECRSGHHASSALLTPQLKPFQGSALMVHNDGVFSDSDFIGFKDIGQGGKGNDATSTGMFGRGALSMFHFTDVPMIISGGYFLILDPRQELLPKNRHFKRKAGVKITLATAYRRFQDQLVPFDGICGYTKDLEYYNGTIFRFPFRNSIPLNSSQEIQHRLYRNNGFKNEWITTDSMKARELLENYFSDASKALLFLQNVRKIEFSIRDDPLPKWAVVADRSESSSDGIFQEVSISTSEKDKKIWRTGLIDIEHCPVGISKPGRGAIKTTECGVAACISHSEANQKVFCRLPTNFASYIPISFHASFAITGDRQSIPFELVQRDAETTRWNRWLLDTCIPELYIEFLKDLVPRIGESSFGFWPSTPKNGHPIFMSDLVAQSFWNKVLDEEHKHWPLYPLVNPKPFRDSTPLVSRPRQSRRLYPTTSSKIAQFDFLPREVSAKLRDLFINTCPKLVCPPQEIQDEIEKLDFGELTQLDSTYLCETFREESNSDYLARFLLVMEPESRWEAITMFLNIVVPLPNENIVDMDLLDGCRILPLHDGSLGTLQLNPTEQVKRYFYPTEEELELFSFASSLFVETAFSQEHSALLSSTSIFCDEASTMPRNPVRDIMKAPFNVRALVIEDIGKLLARPESPTASDLETEDRRIWTVELWLYLNRRIKVIDDLSGVEAFLSMGGLQDQPIYQVNSGQKCRHISPTEFEAGPYILRPKGKGHLALCQEIKDLECVDDTCVPSLLSEAESSLKDPRCFIRLLQALEKIETRTKTPIHQFLIEQLSSSSIEILRELLIHHVTSTDPLKNKPLILALPVWPCQKRQSSPGYIPAKGARFCPYKRMLMSWVKNLENFVTPKVVKTDKASLFRMGVHLMSFQETWNLIKHDLPNSLHEVDSDKYMAFLQCLASSVKPDWWSKIAPDGKGVLCQVSSLFDHDEPIFQAAFRESELTRFLGPQFRAAAIKNFWLDNGLRRKSPDGDVAANDFLQCALAIEARWTLENWDEKFYKDAETVANYLRWGKEDFRSWPKDTWEKIFSVQMFRVEKSMSSECAYRQTRMHHIANQKSHCCLGQIAHKKHKSILWSQIAFLENPPTDFVLGKLPNNGNPLVATVFDHLSFLISICMEVSAGDLAAYLKDIQATYAYLQEYEKEASLIPGIQKANVWVNLDTTEIHSISGRDIESSLGPAQSLCLNCPTDPLPLRVARKFLVPYESLLKALGCQSIVRPSIATRATSTNISEPPMAASLGKMRELREHGHLIDVVFEAEGLQMKAHKIFMAAVSKYCEAQFSGEWGRLLQHQAKISITDMKFKTLSQMVDFAYTGEIEWGVVKDKTDNDEIAESLDELLDLLQATDRWILESLHQKTEDHIISHSDLYVRPDNVLDVQDIAKGARATRLVRLCEEFVKVNADFVAALSQN